MQDNIRLHTGYLYGTLKYLDSGDLVDTYGPGNFIALKFDVPENATSCLVGMDPSEGTGLIEIIDEEVKNGVFKVTDKNTQKFKIVTSDGTQQLTKVYSLERLKCLSE